MTIYRERANGRYEYWTYCDCQRVYLSARVVTKEVNRGAKLIFVV